VTIDPDPPSCKASQYTYHFQHWIWATFTVSGAFDCSRPQFMVVPIGSGAPVSVPVNATEMFLTVYITPVESTSGFTLNCSQSTALPLTNGPRDGLYTCTDGHYFDGDISALPNYNASVSLHCVYPSPLAPLGEYVTSKIFACL
jgi:hypothetical protein